MHLTTFFPDMMPQFLSKIQLLDRPFTNSLQVPNYLVSTNLESDKFSVQIPDNSSAGCGQATGNAIGPAGGVFSTTGGKAMDMVGEHPSWHFAKPLLKAHVRIVQDIDGQEGEVMQDAVYDLSGTTDPVTSQPGSKDILSNMQAEKSNSPHPNFTKFHGLPNIRKKYKIQITDPSGNAQINETLYANAGVYRVLYASSGKGAAPVGHITRLDGTSPDSAAPIASGGLPGNGPGLIIGRGCGGEILGCAAGWRRVHLANFI